MIVVLSDEQLERIEDALASAQAELVRLHSGDAALWGELLDALNLVKASRALLAA